MEQILINIAGIGLFYLIFLLPAMLVTASSYRRYSSNDVVDFIMLNCIAMCIWLCMAFLYVMWPYKVYLFVAILCLVFRPL